MEITAVSKHADFYPMLSDEALQELAADIQVSGQRAPIMVTRHGVLLDGRNRLKACELLGIEPWIEIYKGEDEGAFVRSSNERRHQSTGSRAMSTALSLQADGLRKNGRWKRGSVDNGGSAITGWEHRMKEAGLVLDEMPNLAQSVVDGATALDDAYKQARQAKQQREDEERQRVAVLQDEQKREDHAGRYFDNHPDAKAWLDKKPQGTFETMREAFAAYQEADREARLAEEKRIKAERAAKQEKQDRIDRHARYVEAFVTQFNTGLDMATNPERDEILAACREDIRDRFLAIETTYLQGHNK